MVKARPSLGNIVRHIRNRHGWTLAENESAGRQSAVHARGKIMIPIVSRVHARSMEAFGELRHAGEEFAYEQQLISQAQSEAHKPTKTGRADNAEKPKAIKSPTHKQTPARARRRVGVA